MTDSELIAVSNFILHQLINGIHRNIHYIARKQLLSNTSNKEYVEKIVKRTGKQFDVLYKDAVEYIQNTRILIIDELKNIGEEATQLLNDKNLLEEFLEKISTKMERNDSDFFLQKCD